MNTASNIRQLKLFISFTVAAFVLASLPALAAKPKLIIIPISGDSQVSSEDADYLLDSMSESASLRVAGQITLITKQGAVKNIKGSPDKCKEDCAIAAASKVGAGIALMCELKMHHNKTVGFVKLLDTADKTVLSAKRFIVSGNNLRAIESGMQKAVSYVLSAQFLPLSQAQKNSLAQTQGAVAPVPAPVMTVAAVQPGPPAPSKQINNENTDNNDVLVDDDDSNPVDSDDDDSSYDDDYEPAPEPLTAEVIARKKKTFLITAIVLDAVGLGLSLGSIGFFVKAQKEVDNYNSWLDAQDQITQQYQDGLITKEKYEEQWYLYQDNMDTIDQTVKSNNIAGGIFIGIGGAAIATSILFWVKFAKMKKLQEAATLHINPVFSPGFNGAVLTKTF